jgi:threonine synthase
VAVAAAQAAFRRGEIRADESVACIVTGSGFKDLVAAERMAGGSSCPTVDWAELPSLLNETAAARNASPS